MAVVELEAGHGLGVEVGAEGDGGVEGVGPGFVAEDAIHVGEAADGELELLVGVGVVDAEEQGHGFGLGEEGFVELDEADVGEVVLVEGDVAFVGGAGLDDHGDGGLGGVVVEVAHALVEGGDVVEDALDPAFGEGGRGDPGGPVGAHDGVGGAGGVGGVVAHGVICVDHVGEGVALGADDEADEAVGGVELEGVDGVVVEGGGDGAVGGGPGLAPLEFVEVGAAGEGF